MTCRMAADVVAEDQLANRSHEYGLRFGAEADPAVIVVRHIVAGRCRYFDLIGVTIGDS